MPKPCTISSSWGSDEGSMSCLLERLDLLGTGDEGNWLELEGPGTMTTSESEDTELVLRLRFSPLINGVWDRRGVRSFCLFLVRSCSSRESLRIVELYLFKLRLRKGGCGTHRAVFHALTAASRTGFVLNCPSLVDFLQLGHSDSLTMCSRIHYQ